MSILNKEKILEQARIFIEEGRYDKAIKEYEKILMADPSDMRVKLRIAELYIKRKQVNEAIRVYREVAEAYSGEGFYLKAVTVYKNILRLNPSLMEINEQLADLYVRMGLVNDAVRQYDIYSSALESKGEFEHLLEIRKKVVELLPEDGNARVRLAELYQREGRSEDALDQYEEYARRLEASGVDKARLIDMYEKILSHRIDREDMLRKLIKIYYGAGEIKKALKWLEFAKTLTTVDPELLGMQADIYVRLNQLETARSKYITLADLHREKNDINQAADTLARIALHIPSEEERVEKRAADIDPKALARFKATLEQLREEETEKARKEEMELDEEEVREEKKPPPEEKPKEKPKEEPKEEPKEKPKEAAEEMDWDRTVVVPVDQLLKKTPPKPSAKARAKRRAPVQPMDDRERMKQAKSAYDLGLLYKKLGLAEESKNELAKAAKLYEELRDKSPTASARLSEIRVMIGRVKSKPKPQTPARRTRSESKKAEKKKKAKPEEVKKKKRKISFV